MLVINIDIKVENEILKRVLKDRQEYLEYLQNKNIELVKKLKKMENWNERKRTRQNCWNY